MDLAEHAHRVDSLVREGKFDEAIREARTLLKREAEHADVAFNVAGFLVDAGERGRNRVAVQDGVDLFRRLLSERPCDMGVRYGLANGLGTLAMLDEGAHVRPNFGVRPVPAIEEAIRLHYEVSDRLNDDPQSVINCASFLRVQARIHEATDILAGVLSRHPNHPVAHLKMAEMLSMACGPIGRGVQGAEVFPVAKFHYEQAIDGLRRDGSGPASVADAEGGLAFVNDVIHRFGLARGSRRPHTTDRLGHPLGCRFLNRLPLATEPHRGLFDRLPKSETHDRFVALAESFGIASGHLASSLDATDAPSWGGTSSGSLARTALKEACDVFDKVAWILNAEFAFNAPEDACSFHNVFRPPCKAEKQRLGLNKGDLHPNLLVENPGLLALYGLERSLSRTPDGEGSEPGVHRWIADLRHQFTHSPKPPDGDVRNDAAFAVGLARAAILHAVEAVEWRTWQSPG